ncbi:MAG: anthranilate/aminodeoxychorismate synthase component II [Candidatus Puniceispirillum sp.]|nr:anthranilate/aminodeoxychorismate synthase component II [Candidatus Pelagibacter sp.]MBA4282999.1 anthranilate/aminodeoxychorismate synthase component II [Candidatus Puniceispirillum sp.]
MILMIDNYDSFVYNLYRYCVELKQDVEVIRNDKILIDKISPQSYSGIILSPGPCSPLEAGMSNEIIQKFSGVIPILGVCLGHQCIGHVFGGKVIKAPQPVHGKTSKIQTNLHTTQNNIIFENLPESFEIMRYHSLIVERQSLPECLEITAELADDPIIMALQHKQHKTYGVQFHPESIGSQFGHEMLKNFLNVCDV